MQQCCVSVVQRKVVDPIKRVCAEDLSATVLLASCVAAAVGGVWPVPLTTWVPCTVLNCLFGGHLLLTQTLNLLMTPANIATVVPFKVAGEWVLRADPVDVSIAEVREDAWGVLRNSPLAVAHAVVGWTVFCVAAVVLFFTVLKPLAWCCRRAPRAAASVGEGEVAERTPLRDGSRAGGSGRNGGAVGGGGGPPSQHHSAHPAKPLLPLHVAKSTLLN